MKMKFQLEVEIDPQYDAIVEQRDYPYWASLLQERMNVWLKRLAVDDSAFREFFVTVPQEPKLWATLDQETKDKLIEVVANDGPPNMPAESTWEEYYLKHVSDTDLQEQIDMLVEHEAELTRIQYGE